MRVANHLDLEIGRRLRRSRLIENLTQERLAEKLEISFQQLQKYECGANRVSSSRLWTISRVLGLPIMYFYEGLDDGEISAAIDCAGAGAGVGAGDGDLTDKTIQTARLLQKMPDGEVKNRLFELIRAVSRTQ
ncbi:MAG: helix-turn-helix transcriptional regulator [Rhodospirillales bacterium]|nr:helix-turn-helix transcriptional regulator [Rhodospirillales bacterium]